MRTTLLYFMNSNPVGERDARVVRKPFFDPNKDIPKA